MNVFEVKQIQLKSMRYPSRKTRECFLGLYSSLEKAYEAIQTSVAKRKKEEGESEKEEYDDWTFVDDTMGYVIYEKGVDIPNYCDELSIHTYKKDGTLNDEWFWSDENDPMTLKAYYGCTEKNIRFKPGDIVEVWEFGCSELSIICHLPPSTKEFEEYKKRWEESEPHYVLKEDTNWDSSDYCYLTFSLGKGDTHSHPYAPYVFAPTKKISPSIKLKLQAKLLEENFTFGYRLQISELPFAKDSKVLDELLNGWDKFIDAKYYTGIECLVDYEKADNIKAALSFSEEQSQRFDRFYEECIRLVNEERKNKTSKPN